jgi:hypothetical protein
MEPIRAKKSLQHVLMLIRPLEAQDIQRWLFLPNSDAQLWQMHDDVAEMPMLPL